MASVGSFGCSTKCAGLDPRDISWATLPRNCFPLQLGQVGGNRAMHDTRLKRFRIRPFSRSKWPFACVERQCAHYSCQAMTSW